MKLKEHLANKIILMDGATGTYYAQLTGSNTTVSEKANVSNPEIIKKIHQQYIEAGSKLIRTNTFAANTVSLKTDIRQVKNVIRSGYAIAVDSSKNKEIWVAGNIGPIPEDRDSEEEEIMEEYLTIIDTFMALGANLINFESFSNMHYLKHLIPYIKSKNPDAEIMAEFSLNSFGYTKKGIGVKRLLDRLKTMDELTGFGFNCGVGIGHLYHIVEKLDIEGSNIIVSPNAGYPDTIYERTVFQDNAEYFADMMLDMKNLGVKVIGGCCGTTPKHIKSIYDRINGDDKVVHSTRKKIDKKKKTKAVVKNNFIKKLEQGKFMVAVELDPPHNSNVDRLMECANILKAEGADIITIADSPLGRPRADAMLMANKISKEVGIEVMPHVCCRDKNIIAIKSMIFGAHIEGIRNMLLVTGDPIPSEERLEIKSVFNMNSIGLMNLMQELNYEFDEDDRFCYGGALNPNLTNIDKIIKRVKAKKEAGAKYLLTQPIFDEQGIEVIRQIKEEVEIKILGGIMPLVSYKNAMFIKNEIAGMDIPNDIIRQFGKDMTRAEAEKVGIDIAVSIGQKLKMYVDGVYMMTPFNRVGMIVKILKGIGV